MRYPGRVIVGGVTLAMAAAPVALAGGTNHGASVRAKAESQCRQERTTMGTSSFALAYRTNNNHRNAFGKCVSHRTTQDATDQQSAQQNASQACRAEQNDSNFAAAHNGQTFADTYGTNHNKADAFGKCVSTTANAQTHQDETGQIRAEDNAARQCRTEQSAGPAAFKDKYGAKHNKSNAFGKCVSSTAKAQEESPGSGTNSGSGSSTS